jgi:hypothetical protein
MTGHDDELTNTDMESNKVAYVSSNNLGNGMSPIKVEDESEDMVGTPGGRSAKAKQNRKSNNGGQDSMRSGD